MSSSADDNAYSVFKQDGSHQFYCRWSVEEDRLLSKSVADHGPHKWTLVSRFIPGRTAVQCSTRWFSALNPNVHKGRWSRCEDQALSEAVEYYQLVTKEPTLPWNRIAEKIPHRTGIQCQARWTEALDPAVRKGRWHIDEDELLSKAIIQYGCCWIRVASMIPTRTQRQCRTRWNQIHSQQLKVTSAKATERKKPKAPLDFDFFSPLSNNLFSTNEDQYKFLPSKDSSSVIEDITFQYSSLETSRISRSSSMSSYSPISLNKSQSFSTLNLEDMLDIQYVDTLNLQGIFPTSSNNNLFQPKVSTLDELLSINDFDFLLDL